MMIGGGNYGTAGQHHSGCSFLKFIGIFMAMLIISLPVAFADELQLTYDANGNLLSGDGYNRTYNSLNQLVEIRNSTGSLLEEFVYHPVEERILVKKVYNSSGSIKERIIYVDDNFVRVVNSSGSFDFTYVMHEGQKAAELKYDGSKIFMHNDHLGSTGAITDSVGTVVEQTTYSPYGEIISGGSSRFDYEGKEFDSVVGDYDFHFRKFLGNPPIFTQPDTLIQNVYDPQSLNRYMFERGNPYKNVDEDGHVFFTILAITAIVLLTIAIVSELSVAKIKNDANEVKDSNNFEQAATRSAKAIQSVISYYTGSPDVDEKGIRVGGSQAAEQINENMDVINNYCETNQKICKASEEMISKDIFDTTKINHDILINNKDNYNPKKITSKTSSKTSSSKKNKIIAPRKGKIVEINGKNYFCTNCK